MTHGSVLACLVHERPEVVADLVANIRTLDPSALVLLYDGSSSGGLLEDPRIRRGPEIFVHPKPREMRWGRLHDFAIDSMRFALSELRFDSLTIVDSDQLLVRPGYSTRIAAFLAERPQVGMLGNAPYPQPRSSRIDPVKAAWREPDLWWKFLAGLPGGAHVFPYWTFWPSTVFSRRAAEDLVRMFDDPALQRILARTRMWATEEIILPTLVAATGHSIAASPTSYEYIRYRRGYTTSELERAMRQPDVFWAHPIPRVLDHPLRALIRDRFNGYPVPRPTPRPIIRMAQPPVPADADGTSGDRRSLRAAVLGDALGDAHTDALDDARLDALLPVDDESAWPPIPALGRLIERMGPLEGWLEPNEAAFLALAASSALASTGGLPIVEVGSYCGRGTVVLASVANDYASTSRVHAIDRFDGVVGDADRRLYRGEPTLERFTRNIADLGLTDRVNTIVAAPARAPWATQIGLLVVDALHDYSNVSADFRHFEPWLAPNGLVAFHDYADYCPGVKRLVDELLGSAAYEEAGRAGTLIVLRPLAVTAAATAPRRPGSVDDTPRRSPLPNPRRLPLVSCVMPTYNRRQYVPDAIRYFMAQDYPERELLVVDDGTDPVGDLMPADERIRYLRVSKRLTIGAKRNLACEQARGEYMAHWDDDDWMASWRLRYEMDALLRERADVVGIQTLLYFDPSRERAWRYEYRTPGRAWVHDPTFCYRREVWQAERFADTNFGLDLRFLGSARRKRISVLSDYRFYVGIVHSGNTSPKRTNGSSWRTHDVAEIRSLMAADELAVDRADARSASLAPVG